MKASKIRFEEKEGSVALVSDKKSKLCERCFASVPATEAFCPECGAAMSHATGAEGSDSVVYPELARANLLRMRGDYKAAEDECLKILRRYPNNTTANILLGDICAEKGDLEQSMQWYEMALDLAPESQAAQHKLEGVKTRFKEKETVQTVEQLGLPTTKSRAGVYALALIASIFVIAVVAYFLGQRVEQKRTQIDIGKVSSTGGNGIVVVEQPPKNPPTPIPEDGALLSIIQNSGADGARVQHAFQDPRSRVLVVFYSVLEGEEPKPLGASIAQAAFKQIVDAPVITVRGIGKGKTIYVADALRTKYEETLTSTWQSEHRSTPDAWIDHIMLNEWPSTPVPSSSHATTDVPQDEPPAVDKPAVETDSAEKKKPEEKPAEPKPETDEAAKPPADAGDTPADGPPGDGF